MKKIFLMVMTTILSISSCYAKQTVCESTWSVTAKGITIGVTTEKYINNNDTFEITSHFKPYAAVSLFGVPEIIRVAMSNKDNQLNYRKEIVNPDSENKITEWKMVAPTKWQKIVNNQSQEPLNLSLTVIDSTMFPYLLMLNKINANNENKFTAMGKGDPYPIVFSMETEENTIKVNSSVDNGYMIFNKNNEPIKFGATQQGAKIVGTRTNWNCVEK